MLRRLNFAQGLLATGSGLTTKTVHAAINVQDSDGSGIANDDTGIHTIREGAGLSFTVSNKVLTVDGPDAAAILAKTATTNRYVTSRLATTGAPVL